MAPAPSEADTPEGFNKNEIPTAMATVSASTPRNIKIPRNNFMLNLSEKMEIGLLFRTHEKLSLNRRRIPQKPDAKSRMVCSREKV
jgi:hypothetical protein